MDFIDTMNTSITEGKYRFTHSSVLPVISFVYTYIVMRSNNGRSIKMQSVAQDRVYVAERVVYKRRVQLSRA